MLLLLVLLAAPDPPGPEPEPGGLRAGTSSVAVEPADSPPIPEPAPPDRPAPAPLAPPPAPAGLSQADLDELYERAFLALVSGDEAEARRLLEVLVARAPDQARGRSARRLLDQFGGRQLEPPGLTTTESPGTGALEVTRDGPPTIYSRAELVVLQTIHGIVLGAELCVIFECEGAQEVGGLMLGGGAVAFTTSFLLSRNGISPGATAAINAGAVWGAGLMINLLLAVDEDGIDNAAVGGILAGQVVGMGLGGLAWYTTKAGPGDVSLVSSGGLWTGTLVALLTVIGAGDDGVEGQMIAGAIFGGGVAGLGLGALLAYHVPMSRGRVFIIDGGAVVGTMLGVTLSLLAEAERTSAFIAPALGLAAGLGLTAYLTRNFDLPDAPNVTWWAAPVSEGLMAGVGGHF
jgi:hypothetical protein